MSLGENNPFHDLRSWSWSTVRLLTLPGGGSVSRAPGSGYIIFPGTGPLDLKPKLLAFQRPGIDCLQAIPVRWNTTICSSNPGMPEVASLASHIAS